MATARRATTARKAAPAKPKVVEPEPEVLDEELIDDEDFEEVEESEEAPKPTKKASGRPGADVKFGVRHLCEHLTAKTGKSVQPRELRAMIRRMVRDNSGRVDREIVAGNRTAYDWPLGLRDPEVKAIVDAWMGGEAEAAKQAKFQELKEKDAAARTAGTKKPAAAKKAAAPVRKAAAKKAAPPPVVEEDEELEFDDED